MTIQTGFSRTRRLRSLWALLFPATLLGARMRSELAPPPTTIPSLPAAQRALPLNRFRWSRQAQQDRQGFYYQPAGLCEDYPEEATTLTKIRQDLETVQQTGAKLLRFGIGWDAIQEGPDQYDWQFWDRLVALAPDYGVTLIPYVAYTPRWLARDRREFWRQPPQDLQRFGEFMEVIAKRYRGKIRSWELWNEPDNRDFWLGSAAEYARMAIHGARGVRRADPGAVIVLGGLAREPELFFQELIARHHLEQFLDVVNMHGYLETWDNSRAESYPRRIREIADLRGPKAPDLWLAEFGYSNYRRSADQVSNEVDVIYDYEHTPEYQAAALFKHHVLALATGRLSLTAWYRINDLAPTGAVIGDDNNRHLGILGRDRTPKPAFHALRFYNRLFDQASRCIDPAIRVHAPLGSQSRVHVFEEKGGDVIVVGCLRSSRRSEVQDTSGMAQDRRREPIALNLPRRDLRKLRTYSVKGVPIRTTAIARAGRLSQVVLTGRSVFIAELRR
jgi:hypothetical protein